MLMNQGVWMPLGYALPVVFTRRNGVIAARFPLIELLLAANPVPSGYAAVAIPLDYCRTHMFEVLTSGLLISLRFALIDYSCAQ